jgi:hypothetical protein
MWAKLYVNVFTSLFVLPVYFVLLTEGSNHKTLSVKFVDVK